MRTIEKGRQLRSHNSFVERIENKNRHLIKNRVL